MVLSRMDPRQQAPGPDGNEDEDGEQDEAPEGSGEQLFHNRSFRGTSVLEESF